MGSAPNRRPSEAKLGQAAKCCCASCLVATTVVSGTPSAATLRGKSRCQPTRDSQRQSARQNLIEAVEVERILDRRERRAIRSTARLRQVPTQRATAARDLLAGPHPEPRALSDPLHRNFDTLRTSQGGRLLACPSRAVEDVNSNRVALMSSMRRSSAYEDLKVDCGQRQLEVNSVRPGAHGRPGGYDLHVIRLDSSTQNKKSIGWLDLNVSGSPT
jgi:hypothetical protein